ncbi:pyridoxamine 5'-phosphate oxidase family protein [Salegentibacter sediminis]|uniref:pyridoxamine 5'-phosphate oxidase family protein n=1 Tax=Salegentibacter sediminis TaxID=1930251 RepID=UPI0009BE1828|nr:pyridoxamine 5'-phosphate oxidase family protein [Salegentibacter sediminis]
MSTQHLNHKKALEKMTALVESIKTGMLVTCLSDRPLNAVPMTTKKIDGEGNIWFLSRLDSSQNCNIAQEPEVQLLYSAPGNKEFISIYGMASIHLDPEKLQDLYHTSDDAWFTGLDDPNLTAIKITPKESYYWDEKQNNYADLFKMDKNPEKNKISTGKKGKLQL